MANLSTRKRKKLPSKDFAEPKRRKYPVEDKAHARDALARASANASPADKKKIERKVARKYPSIDKKKGGARKAAKKK